MKLALGKLWVIFGLAVDLGWGGLAPAEPLTEQALAHGPGELTRHGEETIRTWRFPDGQPFLVATWRGDRVVHVIEYLSSGQVFRERFYDDDRKTTLTMTDTQYFITGQKSHFERFKDGVNTESLWWNEQGNALATERPPLRPPLRPPCPSVLRACAPVKRKSWVRLEN